MPEYIGRRLSLAVHRDLIEHYGGTPGLRDEGWLEAALAAPRATFGGGELYPGLADKAAAYLYSLAHGHPFVDGNKRTAFALADTFLRLNGWRLTMTNAELFELVLAAARGELDAAGVAAVFERALDAYPSCTVRTRCSRCRPLATTSIFTRHPSESWGPGPIKG